MEEGGSERKTAIVREMVLRFIQTFNNLSNLERSPLAGLIISFNWPGREGPRRHSVLQCHHIIMTYASAAQQAGWSQLAINFNGHLDNMNVRKASMELREKYAADAIARKSTSVEQGDERRATGRKTRRDMCDMFGKGECGLGRCSCLIVWDQVLWSLGC